MSEKTEHTPIPWHTEGNLIGGDGGLIAEATSFKPERNRANAEFIVRACNSHVALLEACEDAVETLHGEGLEATMQEAAIAKAERE